MNKRKTLFTASLVVTLLLVSSSSVLALIEPQKIQVTEEVQERKERIEDKQAEVKNKVQERKEVLAGKLSDKKKGNVEKITGRIVDRLEARYAKLLKFETTIQGRIDIKEAVGKDVSEAVNKMTELSSYKEGFSNSLLVIQTKLDALLASENPRGMYPELKESIKDSRLVLTEMRKALVEVMKALVQN